MVVDKLCEQVHRAQRRLNTQRFLTLLPWCWFTTLVIAALAIAIHARFPSGLDPVIWNCGGLAVALIVGALAALIWTRVTRHQSLDAAIEIDRRFGLKERVSSSVALSEHERLTEAGRAVVDDAEQRVRRIDVTDRFGLSVGRGMLLPIIPALVAFVAAFAISERGVDQTAVADSAAAQQKKQVKKSSDELRKKIEQRRKDLREKGLKGAEDVLKDIDQGLRDLNERTEGDRKQAMVKLNNLADKLQERRQKMGGADELRRQLNKLKDLKQGPADKLARAMKNGNFKDALDALDELKQKLNDDSLSDEEKKQLADQLDNLKRKLEKIANAHAEAMDDLRQQISDAREGADPETASKLQEALDRLSQKMPQMDKLREMANKLSKASQAAKKGECDEACDALAGLADDLEKLQNELDEMEALESTMDEIRLAKDAMNCDQCGGAGCGACQGGGKGQGQGRGKGEKGGDGLGAGKAGHGARPEQKNKTSSYDSRVKGKVGPGRAVITGTADGQNAKGNVRDAIQAEFESEASGPADPLTGQRLPKSHQRQVEEYFESLRKGN
jgi:hypothetical protein